MKDYLVRGLVESKNCRVFACTTKQLLEIARQKHDLWPTASATLGRFMSATLMLGAMNKNHEKMTVTMNGGGTIGTIMACTNSDGKIKAFVANPHVHYTYEDTGKLGVGMAVGNQGTLQVIKDMGLKEPFVGTVPIQTGEIGEDFSDCRKRGYAGGCRAKRSGDTGHPCRYFGKAGICRFSGTKKEQENGAASPFPRCSFPDHRSAGTTAIAASDCRVGVPPGRDRARAACPGGVFGRDQHHAERSGGDLSGHQGN